MDQELPGNSRKAAQEPSDASPSPLHESVVTGPVIRRKKPLGRRLKETFIAESASSVAAFVVADVVVPQIKNLLRDVLDTAIDRAFNGSNARSRSVSRFTSTGTSTHVSYNRFADNRTRPTQATSIMSNGQPTARRAADPRDSSDIGEIILDTRPEAESILDTLLFDLEKYKRVSVASLVSLLGQTPTPQDHRWGWKDLSNADIKRVAGGYLLVLPPTEDLR